MSQDSEREGIDRDMPREFLGAGPDIDAHIRGWGGVSDRMHLQTETRVQTIDWKRTHS